MPSFKKGTINIGNRQKGRIQGKSIINCPPKSLAIEKSIKKLYSKNFREKTSSAKNLYYKKNTAKKIIKTVSNFPLNNLIIKKIYASSKIK